MRLVLYISIWWSIVDECSTCIWKEYILCYSWVECFINTNEITLVYSVIHTSISFLIFFVLVPSITFINVEMSNYNRFLNVFFQLYQFLFHVFWQCSILVVFKFKVISFWRIDPFIIMKCPFLTLLTSPVLKPTLILI